MGTYAKVLPPLRPEAESYRLLDEVLTGSVDTICSDHAPHRTCDRGELARNQHGARRLTRIELMLPVLLTLVHEGMLDLARLARLTSENVARLYGLYPRKGQSWQGRIRISPLSTYVGGESSGSTRSTRATRTPVACSLAGKRLGHRRRRSCGARW